MVLNSKEAIQYIEARRHHHSGLDKFKEAMNELNNPQDELKSIHIGGTNGKGSSVDYLRSILNEAGYKIGTFTSPYLVSHHDRIRIDNHPISDERLFAYIKSCEKYFEQYDLSMFEIDMMIACLYFKDENVDFAIFEVGMGGRLDATNILTKPLVCGITNIGRDHMAFLGDTDEKIAVEKAGIIKENVDCIGGSKLQECIDVFDSICEKHHARYIQVLPIYEKENGFIYRDAYYELSSKAQYQQMNAAFAIEVIEYLNEKKLLKVNQKMIQQGLKKTEWLGRFEIMQKNPLVIIDGAHNQDGIQALVDSMRKYQDVHVVFSCLKDKEGIKMIQMLMQISNDITVCEFENERADHLEHFEGLNISMEADYQVAIQTALQKKGVVLICGSLYFISLVRKYLLEKQLNN